MATITQVGTPTSDVGNGLIISLFARIRALLWGAPNPVADTEVASSNPEVDESWTVWLLSRIRTFVWVSSGLFSAACFAIPAIGAFAYGTLDGLGNSFLAGIISACLFGLGSVLRFGPDII